MATSYLQVLKGFNRNVRLYLLVHAFIGLSWLGVFFVLFNLYLLRLGFRPQTIGAMNSALGLANALFCPFAGALGKRRGLHRTMSPGLAVMIAGFLLLPLAESFSSAARSLWLLSSLCISAVGPRPS